MPISKDELLKGTEDTEKVELEEFDDHVYIRALNSKEEMEVQRLQMAAAGEDADPSQLADMQQKVEDEIGDEEDLTEQERNQRVMEKMREEGITIDMDSMLTKAHEADVKTVAYGLSNEDNDFEMTPEEAEQLDSRTVQKLSTRIWEKTNKNSERPEGDTKNK